MSKNPYQDRYWGLRKKFDNCACLNYEIRYRETVRGKSFYKQCLDCLKYKKMVAVPEMPDDVKPLDMKGRKELMQMLQDLYKAMQDYRAQEVQKDMSKAVDKEDYHKYIKSPEWKRKRDFRMRMAARVAGTINCEPRCEWCLERPATQVHHLTYLHLGDENITDDLRAVCSVCHAKYHPDKQVNF